MTNSIEERAYKWPRRYVFIASIVVTVTLLALLFLI